MEKSLKKERMREIFDSGITCYTSYFPETKVIINLD